MTEITRFAPSPTGRLHVGNLRAALHNWLWARRNGGTFILRIDDTDLARSEERFVQAIRADLAWFGLTIDREGRQSQRFELYQREFDRLRGAGRVYACYETPEELDLRRKVLLGRGLPPVYERKPADAPVPEGVSPHWRFKLDHDAPIEWLDLIRGPQHFDPAKLSDPVIRRADGSWLYLLPSAIDDVDMRVTTVVRGEDHVSNTALQLQMFAALGAEPPKFAHEALLTGTEGKLSKRLGSLDCDALREEGVEPLALAALLAHLGTSDPVEPVTSLQPLIDGIEFSRFGRAPARFDMAELQTLNAKTLHAVPFADIASRVPTDEATWLAIRPNLTRLEDAHDWLAVIAGPVAASVATEDVDYLAAAARVAQNLDWTGDPWHALTGALKESTDRKGKSLFMPLRQALTGRDHGPDMAALLPLIGKEEALKRLAR